jgi:two-component system cell cycle sensor histidine kinase PleC
MPANQPVATLSPTASDPVTLARLKRIQVALNVRSMQANAYSLPLWALLLDLLFEESPVIGATPWRVSLIWPLTCLVVAVAAHFVVRGFRQAESRGTLDTTFWYRCVVGLHFSIGVAWCLGIWVHWDPVSDANHVFLFVIAIAAAALYGIVRAGDFNIVLVGTGPILASLWFHFLRQDLPFDAVMSVVAPLWSLQFYRDTRSGCAAMREAHLIRIEKERLAEDLVRARDEAETQRAKAVRANATKTNFLANMSHELRTPLNAILGFSEVIATEAFGPDAREHYRDYANDILASGTHLLSLINDLLDVAKIEAGKLELDRHWTDAASLADSCVRVNQDRAEAKGVSLSTAFDGRVSKIYVDERAFRQIALNLVSNAIKFTDEGGGVLVQLKPTPGGCELAVKDTGCGIPASQIDRVFEPFEQVDNRYTRANGGTGLGLTLVRALAELHGGSCSLESEEGRGTTVRVRLPFPTDETNAQPCAMALSA